MSWFLLSPTCVSRPLHYCLVVPSRLIFSMTWWKVLYSLLLRVHEICRPAFSAYKIPGHTYLSIDFDLNCPVRTVSIQWLRKWGSVNRSDLFKFDLQTKAKIRSDASFSLPLCCTPCTPPPQAGHTFSLKAKISERASWTVKWQTKGVLFFQADWEGYFEFIWERFSSDI